MSLEGGKGGEGRGGEGRGGAGRGEREGGYVITVSQHSIGSTRTMVRNYQWTPESQITC